MIKRIIQFLIPLLSCFLCSCATVGIEKAKYEIIQKEGKFEIRQYQSQIVAEIVVESDFTEAGNIAFGRLFNYISGNNRKKETIAMTAPVNQKLRSEKIAMTAPVNQQQSEGKYVVSFVMPSKYTMESLPDPLDSDIKLVQITARKMAAIRYSGSWSQKKYDAQKSLLEDFIKQKGLTATGADIFARYDPPFQLPFLRRIEVLIPVD